MLNAKGEMLIARDPLGIKPLYVAHEVLDSVDDMTELLEKILKEGE